MRTRCWLSQVICALVLVWCTAPASAAITVTSSTVSGTGSAGAVISFTVSAKSDTSAVLAYQWDFGDINSDPTMSPDGTTKSAVRHKYLYTGTFPVSVTITEAGNPTPTVKTGVVIISGSVSSLTLKSVLDFKRSGNDYLRLTGTLPLPQQEYVQNATFNFDIGGVLCGFSTGGKFKGGLTTNANVVSGTLQASGGNKGLFQLFFKKRVGSAQRTSVPFVLSLKKAALQPAWFDEFVFNRFADRETVTIAVKISVSGMTADKNANMVFSGNVTPQFIGKPNLRGLLR